MKKNFIFVFVSASVSASVFRLLSSGFFILFLSCSGLPKIKPVNAVKKQFIFARCGLPFITKKHRFVHTIEALMPDGSSAYMMGITIADPVHGTLHCVMMSIEGLVLFDGEYNSEKKVIINRGVKPFDSKELATGMLRDIRLIFFAPKGKLIESGLFKDDMYGCRYINGHGSFIDTTARDNGEWEINQYDNGYSLKRNIKAFFVNEEGIPKKIKLYAPGLIGYSLDLQLVEAEIIN